MRFLGVLLVIFGVVLLVIGGLTLFIPQDVINLGALSITIHENLIIPMPPIVGLVCLIAGLAMMATAPAPPPY